MSWTKHLKGNSLHWLLDPSEPGVRYLALRDLCGLAADDPELLEARRAAHARGPIATILDAMHPEGYWVNPGHGYTPKYTSTVWAILLLAQLGASALENVRVKQGCAYLLDHTLTSRGQFSTNGAPGGTVDCLQGNLCWALLQLGYDDPRLDLAYEWMARTVTGEGIASSEDRQAELRYYAGKCGPFFACGANNRLACAWGAVKVMLAFGVYPRDRWTPLVEKAVLVGLDFLLGIDPATGAYPTGYSDTPSGNWWKFGFPVYYVTDLLQLAESVAGVGAGNAPRLNNLLALIHEKQDNQGRWLLEYDYAGKTYADFGAKKHPNKWVTLRALRLYRQVYGTHTKD
jgi:hypothetical protein